MSESANAPSVSGGSSPPSKWDPTQYERFKAERSRPFFDLLALVRARPASDSGTAMRVVDLGCGTGELTTELHARLGVTETVGVDSSETMLAKATEHAKKEVSAGEGLRFEQGRIEAWAPAVPVDLVFSNAALHWVEGHEALFTRLRSALVPGGQLAVQMPANDDHPSHVAAGDVAGEAPFREALGGFVRKAPLLPVEEYAGLLHRLGFGEIDVRMQVYGHLLASRAEVIEWVKGTMLTEYARRMSGEMFARFLERYREVLFERLEDRRPYFYTYKRVLIWGGG
jgi:trans-aconitate 2-methyltransferase